MKITKLTVAIVCFASQSWVGTATTGASSNIRGGGSGSGGRGGSRLGENGIDGGGSNRRVLKHDEIGTFLLADIQYNHDDNNNDGDININGKSSGKLSKSNKDKPDKTMNIQLSDGLIYTLTNIDPTFEQRNSKGKGIKSGNAKIKIGSGATIEEGGRIDLHGGAPLVVGGNIDDADDSDLDAIDEEPKGSEGATKGSKGDKQNNSNNRQLQTTSSAIGTKSVLAVRVVASNDSYRYTEEYLSDKVFGTSGDTMNLVSQYKACSYDQLNFVKPPNRSMTSNPKDSTTDIVNGVLSVEVPSSTTQGDQTLINEVTAKISTTFGVHPSNIASHVLYCLPPNTMEGIAFAYIDSWLSVYSNEWCNYLSTQMHEVGHNLGFGHSGEGNDEYSDQSGQMGYSYSQDDGPTMCYNGPKSYQSGWYQSSTMEITPTATTDSCFNGPLYGVANYELGNSAKTVVVKINDERSDEEDYFVAFNDRSGINSGTNEGANQVLVTRAGAEGVAYAPSTLVAKLSSGQFYTINKFGGTNQSVVVSVDSITATSAQVRIEYGGVRCDGDMTPTSSPTPCAGMPLTVNVNTDNYPAETAWTLLNACTGQMQESVARDTMYTTANARYSSEYCVPSAQYTFTITDSYNDGLCCSYGGGEYSVVWGTSIVAQGGQFNDSDSTTFGYCGPQPTDRPSFAPSSKPTVQPTLPPSNAPSPSPSDAPTNLPTKNPTDAPTDAPTKFPTKFPTEQPSHAPSLNPTLPVPTAIPTSQPTNQPSTSKPTAQPSSQPTNKPTSQPSNSPTSSQVKLTQAPTKSPIVPQLPQLVQIGNNGSPAEVFPLGLCQGDCDNNDECQGSLVCFQRDGDEAIPGCDGIGTTGIDYCFDPPPNYLTNLANNLGTNQYGLCQGDCDADSDCQGDLICEQRNGLTAIPGCIGLGETDSDYCRPPDSTAPTASPTTSVTKLILPSPTNAPTPLPTSPPTNGFDCTTISRRRQCRNVANCAWQNRQCVNV